MLRVPSLRLVRIAARCLLPLAVAACSEGRASATGAVMRDSAGIAITESTDPVWKSDAALVLAPEPAVVIGREDDADYQFGRIVAATRLADGRIAVFDGMANELRFFDAQGQLVGKVGGSGGGPGEYKNVSWMQRLAGDSLMLHDMGAQRITVLAPDGAVARSLSLAAAAPPRKAPEAEQGAPRVFMTGMGIYRVLAPFADGTLLARVASAPRLDATSRDSLVYVRLAADGSLRDTIGTFAGDETQARRSGSGENVMIAIGPPPFGKASRVAVDGDGFWFGSADRYELARYTADGRLVRLVRRAVEPLPVTPEDAEARKRKELDRTMSGIPAGMEARFRRMTEEKWANATLPPTFPAHGDLHIDPAGRLWVQETTRPADPIPRWSAFDADGRYLGTVALPEDFRVLEFGADYVLGVQRDENDVEQVRLYALQPGGAGAA
ncbi:MAG TPA: 6-bladed beta-propeller [Gemmatimonadaceae bacterium]|nr:6-bladed beta-propeller [Gemmatimonadaceae bacterium]